MEKIQLGHAAFHPFEPAKKITPPPLREAEWAGLRILALKAYPELKRSGLCSRHRDDGHYECHTCYPDLNALLDEHMQVFNELYDQLLTLSGLSDPSYGRIGTNAIIAELQRKLSLIHIQNKPRDDIVTPRGNWVGRFVRRWWPPALRRELAHQKLMLRHACSDWAEDHTHLQDLCRAAGCTELEIEGDRWGVSGVMDLADSLRDKLSKRDEHS